MSTAVLNVNPNENIICGYRPVMNRVTATIAEATLPRAPYIEHVEAQVKLNGTLVATIRKDWYSRIEITATNWEYKWDVDVQRVVQDFLLPNRGVKSKVFGEMGEKRIGEYPEDATVDVEVDIYIFYRDVDNLLKDAGGGPFNGNLAVCVPFALPNYITQGLYGDGKWVWWSSGNTINLLTNIPSTGAPVSINDNGWLAWIHNGDFTEMNAYRLRIYSTAGTLVETKIMVYDEFTGDDELDDEKKILSIGSGPVQLNKTTEVSDWWFEFGGPDNVYILATHGYYLIDVGLSDTAGSPGNFASVSNSVRYNMGPVGEKRSFRIHFLNRFGMAEAYTFDCIRRRKKSVTSSKGRKSLGWDTDKFATWEEHNPEDYGQFRFGIDSDIIYELESKPLNDDEAKWLEELTDTVEAYWEDQDNNVLRRVVIQDVSEIITEDSEEFQLKLFLNVMLSNSIIRQNY